MCSRKWAVARDTTSCYFTLTHLCRVPIMAGTSVDEWVARVTPAYVVDVAKHRRRIRKKSRKPSRPLRLWTLLLQLLRFSVYLHYTKHTKVSERKATSCERIIHYVDETYTTKLNINLTTM